MTASVTVGLAQASGSSDTINGANNLLFTTPYFGATLFSDGVSKWTAIGLAAGGTGSALLYTQQTLTAAQQRQALANLALLHANFRMTEIRAATPGYFGLVDGLADNFLDSSGIDTANAVNASVQNGAVYNQNLDANTKALLHFDGVNNSTTMSDDVGHAFSVVGGAKISTAQQVFGTGSLLTSASGDAVQTASSTDFGVGTGDFTVNLRVRPSAFASGSGIWDMRAGGSTGLAAWINGSGQVYVTDNSSTLLTGTVAVSLNTWADIEIARASGTLRIFVNGSLAGSVANSTSFGTSAPIVIGNSGTLTQGQAAYYDEFRFSNVARHTAAFTPATQAFSYGTSGVLTLPSVNYALSGGVPTKGSIFIRARATADVISPNTNFIASLSRSGALGGSNSLDVTLAATAVLPDGYTHYEANEVDLTGLTSGQTLKGSLRTVGTTLGVAIDGWRIRAA